MPANFARVRRVRHNQVRAAELRMRFASVSHGIRLVMLRWLVECVRR